VLVNLRIQKLSLFAQKINKKLNQGVSRVDFGKSIGHEDFYTTQKKLFSLALMHILLMKRSIGNPAPQDSGAGMQ
jgi:hypothetical protein